MKALIAGLLLLLSPLAKADWTNFATPVNFTQNGNNVTVNISGSQVNQITNFQGVFQSFNSPAPWTISATLNITTDYMSDNRAAFIVAVPFAETPYVADGSDNPLYLTFGIRDSKWEVWDGNEFEVLGNGATGFHTFSITADASQYSYAVDGATLASYPQSVSSLIGMQLVSYNYGSDYTSQWSGVTPEPSLALGLLVLLMRNRRSLDGKEVAMY